MIKIKNRHILNIWAYLYGWAMSQKLPAKGFDWVEDSSEFVEGFIKSYNEKSKEYLKLIFSIWKIYITHKTSCHFDQSR